MNDSEILDSYIADVKLKATTTELHSLSYLFSDYSKDIDSDTTNLYDLQLHSTTKLVEVTTTVDTPVVQGGGGGGDSIGKYDIYKFNKYPGYQGFTDDLYAWYKFEKANTEPITSIAPNMIDSSNVYLAFKHDGSTDNQTEYTVNFPEDTTCDILIVGGGGAGGSGGLGGGGWCRWCCIY